MIQDTRDVTPNSQEVAGVPMIKCKGNEEPVKGNHPAISVTVHFLTVLPILILFVIIITPS